MAKKQHQGNAHLLANGHAELNGAVEKIEAQIYEEENIFLFIPNIIGMAPDDCMPVASSS
jgi:hypothetical protein